MIEAIGRDPLCRYYTLPHIGKLLIELMARETTPRRLIDLGAGAGTLCDAASRRWAETQIVTVDVDGTCAPNLRARLRNSERRHIHHIHDALDPNLPGIVSGGGPIDAAICNPPYIRPEWRPGYERVLDEAGLADAFASPKEVTTEALFLAQSIRLTSHGGSIGLIVPDGLITGLRTVSLRRALFARHRVDAVVQLPRSSFKDADAQAFLLVFGNYAQRTRQVRLMRYCHDAGLSSPIYIDRGKGEHRLDYDFHALGGSSTLRTLRQIGAEVARGSINATVARSEGMRVFHTSDFDVQSTRRLVFPEGTIPVLPGNSPVVVAVPGDVLVARVDRNLHRKVAFVVEGRVALTDCVHRVRVPQPYTEHVFATLASEAGSGRLAAATRGVGARHLCKAELLDLPLFPTIERPHG